MTEIASQLNVSEKEVSEMEGRMSGNDYSLNAVVSADGQEEWQEWLVDEDADHEVKIAEIIPAFPKASLFQETESVQNVEATRESVTTEAKKPIETAPP